jgi:polyhydroxybutyrate depolymerase
LGGWPGFRCAFIQGLIAEIVHVGFSDPRRIYIAGYSNGGMLALRLMCEAPALIAAAAIVAASMPREMAQSCKARPTPILVMNGTADQIVPYRGGALALGNGEVLSTDEMLRFFHVLNHCTESMRLSQLPDIDRDDGSYVTVASWTNCVTGAPVMLYRIGGGHRIPGYRKEWPIADLMLGAMNHDFEAAHAIWNFFKDKRLRW